MNSKVLPRRYQVLWSLILLPLLIILVLLVYIGLTLSVTNGEERLLLAAFFMGIGARVDLMHLFIFYQARYTLPGYQAGIKIARVVIVGSLVFLLAVVYFAFWLVTPEILAALDKGMYSLTSLTVVLNLTLGALWVISIVENAMLYFYTYSERYRKFWFGHFFATGQIKPKDEEK